MYYIPYPSYDYFLDLMIEKDNETHEEFTSNTKMLVEDFQNYLGSRFHVYEASEVLEEKLHPMDFKNSEVYPIDFCFPDDSEEWFFRLNYELNTLATFKLNTELFIYNIEKWSELSLKAMLNRSLWFRMMQNK